MNYLTVGFPFLADTQREYGRMHWTEVVAEVRWRPSKGTTAVPGTCDGGYVDGACYVVH